MTETVVVRTDDGVDLHVEMSGPTGAGPPILFLHEFGGDHRSWAPQVHHFAETRRCVSYDARGFPPSSVPTNASAYSQGRAVADAIAVLDGLGIDRAHMVGNSMGGFAALHLGLRHPQRAASLVVAGCGYGAEPAATADFRADAHAIADQYDHEGSAAVAASYGARPARLQLRAKDPAGYAEHIRIMAEHDAVGAALTMRGVQAGRPSLFDLRAELARMTVPTLVVVGDQDTGALAASRMLAETLPDVGLAVLPRSGHLTNLEEPALFALLVQTLIDRAEQPAR